MLELIAANRVRETSDKEKEREGWLERAWRINKSEAMSRSAPKAL